MGGQLTDLFSDGASSTISLRGFGENASANTLVLLDGIPLSTPDMSLLNLNLIPSFDMKFY